MDTKLKKSSKLAKLIICLSILIPAILLVCLYPRMEKLMLEKQEGYKEDLASNATEVVQQNHYYQNYAGISVRQDMVNYAVEAAYYLYGRLLQEARGKAVDFEVLDTHGWINDYYTVSGESLYYVDYENAGESDFDSNITDIQLVKEIETQMFSINKEDIQRYAQEYGIVCSLFMEFDEYGMISNIEFVGANGVEYQENLYEVARNSVKQYSQNAAYYNSSHSQVVDVTEMVPKNFKALFLIPMESMFINQFNIDLNSYMQYFNDPENLYINMGAPIVVLIFMVIVAMVALILPFFKKLNTGWEAIFCLPFEIICILAVGMVIGVYLMFIGMCHTTVTEIGQIIGSVEILGYTLETGTIYGLFLTAGIVGWALCFGLEYTIVAHCRQFLCGPIYYFKHRLLIVRFVRWIGKQFKRLYHFIVDIDMDKGLHSTIVKIVLMNLIVGAGFCCLWFVGIIGVVLYGLVLYVLLRRHGKQIQEQYESVLHVTKQMAKGELKVALHKELGVFATLGEELEKVQEGFSKAVAEEAKSQNMKTELISNVSHDLKTPLTAIITYVSLLKQDNISEADRKNYIQTLDIKSQRLKVLIEDLFEVSKAQSGNIQMNFMDVDVVNIMKQLRLEMEDKLADSELTFRWNLPEEKVILNLDGQKTYRVFENLLSNALKYALKGSRVYIDVIKQEELVEVVFKNISAVELHADAERLTDRFVRGDAARTTEGSGLGLAIVKSFVELQGGSFKIDIDGDLFKAIIIWKK